MDLPLPLGEAWGCLSVAPRDEGAGGYRGPGRPHGAAPTGTDEGGVGARSPRPGSSGEDGGGETPPLPLAASPRRRVTPSERPLRLGILISGRGSNMQAIVRNIEAGTLAARVALVVSNHADAPGLVWARDKGLPTAILELGDYASREAHNAAMAARLLEAEVDLVAMAGYDRLITHEMFQAFPDRIMNIHPSLLPSFPGTLHAQAEALEYGVKVTGCTVHFVAEGAVDAGPIILQSAVPVVEGDDAQSLAVRILQQEHLIYSQAIQLYAEGRLRIDGRRVRIVETSD